MSGECEALRVGVESRPFDPSTFELEEEAWGSGPYTITSLHHYIITSFTSPLHFLISSQLNFSQVVQLFSYVLPVTTQVIPPCTIWTQRPHHFLSSKLEPPSCHPPPVTPSQVESLLKVCC